MAKNFINSGKTIHAAATDPAVPVSGSPVIVGTIPGVALTGEGEGGNAAGECTIATKGVFDLLVTGEDDAGDPAAIAVGDKLYYTDGVISPIMSQIDAITLTGESGTANVTLAGGLTKLVTFGDDLADTADDFVTSHAAAYDAVGIVVTAVEGVLIFTAKVPGTAFVHPAIANATGDLAGTVENVRSNSTLYGKALEAIAAGDPTPDTDTINVLLVQA